MTADVFDAVATAGTVCVADRRKDNRYADRPIRVRCLPCGVAHKGLENLAGGEFSGADIMTGYFLMAARPGSQMALSAS
jgi:hypothetical protein